MAYNELKQHGTEDFPIELYCINKNHPKYEMAHHWHSNMEIICILKGKAVVRLDVRTYNVQAGDILFVNSEVVHSVIPEECEYECIVFDPHFLAINSEFEGFANHIANHEIFIKELAQDQKIKKIVMDLSDSIRNCNSGYKLKATGLLYILFGEITSQSFFEERLYTENENAKNIYKLKKVLNYIRKSYSKQITLKDMAKVADVSPKYFCSFFKSATSKTPMEYLNSYRIEKAATKLLSSDSSVTDIAYSCGFNDLSYFIKVFKNLKGISPRKFRLNKK